MLNSLDEVLEALAEASLSVFETACENLKVVRDTKGRLGSAVSRLATVDINELSRAMVYSDGAGEHFVEFGALAPGKAVDWNLQQSLLSLANNIAFNNLAKDMFGNNDAPAPMAPLYASHNQSMAMLGIFIHHAMISTREFVAKKILEEFQTDRERAGELAMLLARRQSKELQGDLGALRSLIMNADEANALIKSLLIPPLPLVVVHKKTAATRQSNGVWLTDEKAEGYRQHLARQQAQGAGRRD